MNQQHAEYIKLVVRRMYDAQKLRIQSDLRLQRLVRDEIILKEDAERDFKAALEYEKKTEHEYEKIVWREIKNLPVVEQWLCKVKGIGPRLGGLLVALIGDIGKFATVSKLWAYCGLHVIDGKAVKRAKGQKSNWSSELKQTAWKISNSFVKAGGPYREIYDQYKMRIIAREIANGNVIWKKSDSGKASVAHSPKAMKIKELKAPANPEWTLGRINNMALRYISKMFLSHLWHVWREIEDLPTESPYIIGKDGHSHLIDPWSMVEPDKKKGAA